MSLTREQRAALSDDQFALPDVRKFPIHDEEHVRMAFSILASATNLSDEQRSSARHRIQARAEELGIDIRPWMKISALSFEAMSLDVPTTADHPNKMEFSGVLTKLDQASDLAPHGSNGKKVFIPKEVAEKALPTLLGMAIDLTTDMDGHDRKRKIGVITAATVEGRDIRISGFFYANDFPKEVKMIQARKGELGFSFEAERILVADLDSDPLRIESLVFTGAAVLQKNKAAYQTTSIAASAEEITMTKEELQAAITAAMGPVVARLDKIEQNRIEAASVADKVADHAKKLHDTANAMQAAGIGCHQTRGHAAILHNMADEMMAEAHRGSIPSAYHGMSMYAAGADQTTGPDEETKRQLAELKTGLEAAKTENANLKTKVTDLEAAATRQSAAPQRQTLPPRITALMAKGQLTMPSEGGKFTIPAIDAALKGTSLNPQERMEVKIGLERAGLVDKAAA